ncbi:MAG: VWA domain-containing protein [Bifidobacteriaceae bacterium]|jgi:Ca-activated chloride channel family protein|nr:VWA domain-containing protein [Bifidobacteriaceae bacterium]
MRSVHTRVLTCIVALGLAALSGCSAENGEDAVSAEAGQLRAPEENSVGADALEEPAVPEPQGDLPDMAAPGEDDAEAPDGADSRVTAESVIDNQWVNVAEQDTSTFSADVDTASYTIVRQLLQTGQWYQGMGAQARIEEMVNYFDYAWPAPDESSTRPFQITTQVHAAPWDPTHQLAVIGVKAKQAIPTDLGNNIVLLVDVSGSMQDANKLPLLAQSLSKMVEKLGDRDRVSLVTYADGNATVLDGVSGSEHDQIVDALNSLTAGGGTDGSSGLKTAYEIAEKHFVEGGNNRVILATDGDFNLGTVDVDELKAWIGEARERDISISVLGFGMLVNDSIMETIADNGNGNYFYIDTPSEAERALVRQFDSAMYTVAKDLKLQVVFNASAVKQYRLIGYENRTLANEDFADDTVDAGDVGSGHTVTALYELVPGDAETGGGQDGTWMTVSSRYKAPDGDASQLDEFTVEKGEDSTPSTDWRWAVAVTEFGLILRESEYKGDATIEQVKSLAEGAQGEDPLRAEFIELVDEYRLTVAGG